MRIGYLTWAELIFDLSVSVTREKWADTNIDNPWPGEETHRTKAKKIRIATILNEEMTRWGLTTYKANAEMWTFQQQRILGCEYETMPGTPDPGDPGP